MIRVLVILLLILGSLAPTGTALAQEPADTDPQQGLIGQLTDPLVRMRVRPLADGVVRTDEWASLWVELTNLGEPVAGTLVVRTRDLTGEETPYLRRVELPAGTRKAVHLLYKPGLGSSSQVVVFAAGARSVEAEVVLRPVGADDVLVGVLGEDPVGVNAIRAAWGGRVPARNAMVVDREGFEVEERNVAVGLVPVAQLPDRHHPLLPIQWLVWPEADPTALTPEQARALEAYVAGGGHLFLTVSDRWRQVQEGPLGPMLPVTLTGSEVGRSAAALGRALSRGGPTPEGPQAIATLRDDPERATWALFTAEDRVVWAAGTHGLGTVHVLTVSPDATALAMERDPEGLWRRLLWLPPPQASGRWFGVGGGAQGTLPPAVDLVFPTDHRGVLPPAELLASLHLLTPDPAMSYAGHAGAPHDTYGATVPVWAEGLMDFLQDIPGVAPLPLPWLLGFAVAYLVVIGPLDYLVLRALGRQPLTWITFPVAIAVFSALALAGTRYVKGSQAVVTRYELVDVLPGTDLWRGASWYGIWATRAADLSLTSGFSDGVAEVVPGRGFRTEPSVLHGPGGSALAWSVQTWTLSHARTSWTAPGSGGFRLYEREGGWRVVNDTDLDLSDAVLDLQTRRLRVGTLPAGASVDVDAAAGAPRGPHQWPLDTEDLDAANDWAIQSATDVPEVGRGHLSWESHRAVLLGVADRPVEPSVLDGLTPVPRSYTVVRAPFPRALPPEAAP